MQIVEIPGVGEVEFPDSMNDAEIAAAARKLHGGAAPRLTEAEMMRDLQTADASGDTELAQHIAGRIKAARAATPPQVRGVESGARGALQGLTAGWGDEAAAGIAAALPFTDREAAKGDTLAERYRNARDFYRTRNASAEQANPGTYLAGEMTGAMAPALTGAGAATGGRALLRAAAQGTAQGAGYSEKGDAGGLAEDAAIGTGFGLAGHAAGKLLSRGTSAISRKASGLANVARARAGAQAAKETAEQLASASGTLGAEVQKGSRYVENLMRLEESMTPAQRALYDQAVAAGVVPKLQQAVAQSTLERLPGQAGSIAARQAELEALQQAAPQLVTERAQALLTPQVGADARSFLKSYAEPLAWAYGANKVAEGLGGDGETRAVAAGAAGLIGGRTRGGKALLTRIKRPAHQLAAAEAAKRAAEGKLVKALQEALRRGVPAVATDKATED